MMYEYTPNEVNDTLNRYSAIYCIRNLFAYVFESAEIAVQLQEVYIRQDEQLSHYQDSFRQIFNEVNFKKHQYHMEFLEKHSYEYMTPEKYMTLEVQNNYYAICDHVNAAGYLFSLYEWECFKLMNSKFEADREHNTAVINNLNYELQRELGRMFDHIFGEIYVPEAGCESWKPESLTYFRQLVNILNYFIDVGINTKYDCFNTYVGRRQNKTKLDYVEEFLWEQEEFKADLRHKLLTHPNRHAATYQHRLKIFNNLSPYFTESNVFDQEEETVEDDDDPIDAAMLELYLDNVTPQKVFQFKLTQKHINKMPASFKSDRFKVTDEKSLDRT